MRRAHSSRTQQPCVSNPALASSFPDRSRYVPASGWICTTSSISLVGTPYFLSPPLSIIGGPRGPTCVRHSTRHVSSLCTAPSENNSRQESPANNQIMGLARTYASSSSFLQFFLPTVEHLYVIDGFPLLHRQRNVKSRKGNGWILLPPRTISTYHGNVCPISRQPYKNTSGKG